jgi:pimeloyl-ACP methyl ester carboxylesterase
VAGRAQSVAASGTLVAHLRRDTNDGHVVALSWGGGVAPACSSVTDLVDRAVIDGAGVPPWWGGKLILAGVTAVSPFLHTCPVIALFGGVIGMDEEGRADRRASSRRAFQRGFIEGFKTRPSRLVVGALCPTLVVAEKETVVRPSKTACSSSATVTWRLHRVPR